MPSWMASLSENGVKIAIAPMAMNTAAPVLISTSPKK